MYSKWADACTQILAFDRLDDIAVDISGEPFCKHIVNLFVQLSALATVRLHAETIDFRNEHEMDADYEKLCRGARRAPRQSLHARPFGRRHGTRVCSTLSHECGRHALPCDARNQASWRGTRTSSSNRMRSSSSAARRTGCAAGFTQLL
eukprot:7053990-Prymnesium_polylepis.1